MLLSLHTLAQQEKLTGAFSLKQKNENILWLFKDGYASQIVYKDSEYTGTKGGPFQFDGKSIVILTEYNDRYPDSVGLKIKLPATLQQHKLQLSGLTFHKVKNKPQALDALWRISGRQVDNKVYPIPRTDRKTIKILVDGYFQWIAINPAEKGFYGTGGGIYTYNPSKYTENILFFSRDNTRAGAKLDFKGELINGEWHHSGKSSKGDAIYEIWAKEK